jgi:hypothetical protein
VWRYRSTRKARSRGASRRRGHSEVEEARSWRRAERRGGHHRSSRGRAERQGGVEVWRVRLRGKENGERGRLATSGYEVVLVAWWG